MSSNQKIGRNDPCYCGSGKKYKHCHEQQAKANTSRKKAVMLGLIIGILVVIASIIMFTSTEPAGTSAPPGPAPPGKVWSEEHGHWHDA